jgi:hypothetical protein
MVPFSPLTLGKDKSFLLIHLVWLVLQKAKVVEHFLSTYPRSEMNSNVLLFFSISFFKYKRIKTILRRQKNSCIYFNNNNLYNIFFVESLKHVYQINGWWSKDVYKYKMEN